jgi:predicted permease
MTSAMLHQLRFAARGLRRTPGFALVAVLTLAVGIGVATAVFTVAYHVLARPLPVRDEARVVVLWGATSDGRFDNFPLLLPDAREFAARTQSLEHTEFFSYGGAQLVAIRDGGRVYRLRQALVSGGYFDLLGTRPALGRSLRPEDDITGAPDVVVLSHRAWQRYFGGDQDIVGRRLVMHASGAAHTIVGVMPPGMEYPEGTDIWAPVIPSSKPFGDAPIYAELNIVGRLRRGASAADARDELTTYFARADAPAWQRDVHGVVHSLRAAMIGDVRPAVLAFGSAAGLLLLITCINVANLLLVRGLARVREIAVRAALGAGRARIIGALLTESALLALGGGLVGTALAAAAIRGFIAFAPAGSPQLDGMQLNGTVIGVAIAVTATVTLIFALAPAVVTSRVELHDALRSGSRQGGASRRFRIGTEALVVGQIALALLVLSVAALIARSLVKLERVDLAFDTSHLLIVELALPYGGFGDTKNQSALLDRLLPRVGAVPGVRAITPVLTVPFVKVGGIFGQLPAEGQSADEMARNPTLILDIVTPDYFETFGIPVLRGRRFSPNDRMGAPPVVMISESAARHYWPDADPIGKRLKFGAEGGMVTVVGVVPETRYRDLNDPRPSVYFPLAQSTFPVLPMTLAIRADGAPEALVPGIRQAVAEIEPGAALASAAPVATFLEGPLAQARLNAFLLVAFAIASVLLAAVGLFAITATMVRLRTRELGIRMALGATASEVRGLVLRRGMQLGALGTGLGLLGALASNRLLTSMLFDISPTDATTLMTVSLGLLGVAALASAVPARASTRIDPAAALRAE